MAKTSSPTNKDARFGTLIEGKNGRDFPFYNDKPFGLKIWQWITVILAAAAGFLALSFIPATNNVESLIPRFLFLALPLGTFMYFSKGTWKALFRKPTKGDVLSIFVFYLLTIVVSSLVGILIQSLVTTTPNAAGAGLAGAGWLEITAFYVGTAIQLLGEEVFTLLPFLAVMYFVYRTGKVSRKTAIVIAFILSTVWFAAAHLPTYGWNVLQAFLIIGSARVIMTWAYIRTKNLWVSYGAHLLNDWVIFTFIMLAAVVKG